MYCVWPVRESPFDSLFLIFVLLTSSSTKLFFSQLLIRIYTKFTYLLIHDCIQLNLKTTTTNKQVINALKSFNASANILFKYYTIFLFIYWTNREWSKCSGTAQTKRNSMMWKINTTYSWIFTSSFFQIRLYWYEN